MFDASFRPVLMNFPKYTRVPGMYWAKQRGANYEENEAKVRKLPLLQLSLSKFFLYRMCSKWSTSKNCSSQPSIVHWLSGSIFPCLFFRPSCYGDIRPNLHFFQYIQALKPHINPLPLNSKQYQVILTQYHQVPTSTAFY